MKGETSFGLFGAGFSAGGGQENNETSLSLYNDVQNMRTNEAVVSTTYFTQIKSFDSNTRRNKPIGNKLDFISIQFQIL